MLQSAGTLKRCRYGHVIVVLHKNGAKPEQEPCLQPSRPSPPQSLQPFSTVHHTIENLTIFSTASKFDQMATAFESSLSASALRPSADAPSMADSLPSVQFGFDDLRERMNRFTARFDAFIEQGRKRVLEERNQFRMNIAELRGTLRTSARPVAMSSTAKQAVPKRIPSHADT
jgi:hypothetical protein